MDELYEELLKVYPFRAFLSEAHTRLLADATARLVLADPPRWRQALGIKAPRAPQPLGKVRAIGYPKPEDRYSVHHARSGRAVAHVRRNSRTGALECNQCGAGRCRHLEHVEAFLGARDGEPAAVGSSRRS